MTIVKIELLMKERKTGQTAKIVSMIKDGQVVTRYTHPVMAKMSFSYLRKFNNKDGYTVKMVSDDTISEKFKWKNQEEIEKYIMDQFEKAKKIVATKVLFDYDIRRVVLQK